MLAAIKRVAEFKIRRGLIYASDGTTVLATVTDTISYSGIFETGRTRVIA